MSDVTRMLSAVEAGESRAAADLLPLVYDELRKLAARKLAHEVAGQTLQGTALVHEAYLRLVGAAAAGDTDDANGSGSRGPRRYVDGRHFFAAAAAAMRHILTDNARRKLALKHGGHGTAQATAPSTGDGTARSVARPQREPLESLAAPEPDEELLALDEALGRLAALDPQKARLVELRYFAGLTGDQAAAALGISPSTADRHWAFARAWLQAEVRGGDEDGA